MKEHGQSINLPASGPPDLVEIRPDAIGLLELTPKRAFTIADMSVTIFLDGDLAVIPNWEGSRKDRTTNDYPARLRSKLYF
jgi:hypothetical protein